MRLKDCFHINPSNNTNKFEDFINYIDTSSTSNGFLLGVQFLEEEFPSRAQRLIKKNDILYSTVRPYLRHFYLYKDNYEHAVASTGYALLRKKKEYEEIVDEKFIYYFLASQSIVDYLGNIAELSQTTFPSFTPKDIARISIPEISYDKQKNIANSLFKYDQLIELNNKRIKLLEQTAQEIYKEWFVRFRFPGYDKVEFEHGIPKEWSYKRINTFIEFDRGISYSSEDIDTDNGINLINLGNIVGYGGFKKEGVKQYQGKYKPEQVVKNHDLIMGITDMTQDRRTVGYVGLVEDINENPNVMSMDLVKIKSEFSNYYLFCLFTYGGVSKYISQYANGTNVLHLRPTDALKVKVLLPKTEIINLFSKLIKPLFEEINKLNNKNDNLTKQRDYLLPRLMSGKLEV